jgi:hypothetical protein
MNIKKSAEEEAETNSRNNVHIEYTSARGAQNNASLLRVSSS